MSTSKTAPNDWMTKPGSEKIGAPFATTRGWEIIGTNGIAEVIHAVSGLLAETLPVAATIQNIINPDALLSVGAGDNVVFQLFMSEPVTVTGTPQVVFEMNGLPVTADYVAASSTSTVLWFEVAAALDAVQATADVNLTGDVVTSVTITAAGTGYTTADDHGRVVTFDGDGAGATGTLVVTLDVVTDITITDGGTGYTAATVVIPPSLRYDKVDTVTETVSLNGGTINGIVFTPEATATGDVTVVTGAVDSVAITDAGLGYTTADDHGAAVTFDGDGSGATGTLIVVADVVTGVTVTAGGSLYTAATVTLPDPLGETAAILTFNPEYAQPTTVIVA